MTLNGGKYACSRARERGACANKKIIAAQSVERRVLEGLREHLLSPLAIKRAVTEAAERWWAEHNAAVAARLPLERELAELDRRLTRVQDLYVAGQIEMEEVKRRSQPLLSRRNEVSDQLALAASPPPSNIRPFAHVAEAYLRMADRLHLALDGDDAEELRN